ncbi:hypothetical protein [Salinicola avicenniae]|uniref:hypothetical protein n=1 Tax=Salinicola avicenniae TaxID=2916836 RepID=UPI0020737827|nr:MULTISPECIES: hypothetical protein [unclassified Salinicola]
MIHPRQQIRDEIVTAITGNTDARLNVWASRALPVWNGSQGLRAVMPAILIYTRSEQAEIFNEAPREYRRVLQIGVQLHVLGAENTDDRLDALAAQVETQLLHDETLNGTCSDLRLFDSEFTFTDDGEHEMGAARLTFEATYFDEIDKRVEDTLQTLGVRWDLARPDGNYEAEDRITPSQSEE